MNTNWLRWIYASISTHFQTAADAYPIEMFLEGVERDTNQYTKWIEFRLNGPVVQEVSHSVFDLVVDASILWSVNIAATTFHEPFKVSGMLLAACDDICCFKYGNTDDDDDTFLNTLIAEGPARVQNFGQIDKNVQIVQGLVEQKYRMILTS